MEGPKMATAALDEPEAMARPRRWWAALLLGLLQPGLGQLYNGEVGKALAFFALPYLFLAAFAATALRPIPFAIPLLLLALSGLSQLGAAAEAAWAAGQSSPTTRRRRYDRWYVYILVLALAWLSSLAALRVARRSIQSFRIPSHAMEPTILPGDCVLVDKARFRQAAPRRGDIVIYRSLENRRSKLITRLVGSGGERVEMHDKALLVDGQELHEPYAVHRDPRVYAGADIPAFLRARDNFGPYVVPEGQLFVLGDNRDNSYDSRFLGAVPRSSVEGGGRIRVYWSRDPTTGDVRWNRIGRFLR
jgi:signal peptidase I